jgi:hypothetical protein
MDNALKTVKSLCRPAQLYLFLSALSIISVFISTMKLSNLVGSVIIALVWTFILNKICQGGYTTISWILVLLPILGGLGLFIGLGAGLRL